VSVAVPMSGCNPYTENCPVDEPLIHKGEHAPS
jgi:hypothetical protein